MGTSTRSGASAILPEGRAGRRSSALTVLLVVVAATLGAHAADQAAPISVALSTLTGEIHPYQPLRLIVEARVVAERGFVGAMRLDPDGHAVLEVTGPNGTRKLMFAHLTWERARDAVPDRTGRPYQPGYSVRADILALYDFSADEYIFASPGRYRLHAHVPVHEGEEAPYRELWVESNGAQVEVVRPTVDAAAADLWIRPWQMEVFRGFGLRDIRTWLASHLESSYAHYAGLTLAGSKELPAAERIELLTQLAGAAPPPQIADLALLQLAELLLGEKDYDGCRSYAEQVVALPTAPEHSKAKARDLIQRASRRLETQPPGAAPR